METWGCTTNSKLHHPSLVVTWQQLIIDVVSVDHRTASWSLFDCIHCPPRNITELQNETAKNPFKKMYQSIISKPSEEEPEI